MTDAWDDEDRAIARALGVDAPDPGGAPAPDAELVAEYENVVAQFPFESVAARPELENQVVAAALARRPAAARAIDGGRSTRRRSTTPRWIAIGATLAVAAALVVALAVERPGQGPGSPGARIAPVASTGSVTQVLSEPGTRKGVLANASGTTTGRVALGPDGQGYLYDLTAPPSAGMQWLWLDTASGPVLVGRMTTSPAVHFVVRGDLDAVHGVFVTVEKGAPSVPGPLSSRATLSRVS